MAGFGEEVRKTNSPWGESKSGNSKFKDFYVRKYGNSTAVKKNEPAKPATVPGASVVAGTPAATRALPHLVGASAGGGAPVAYIQLPVNPAMPPRKRKF